ncbi:YicC family protein [Candidatus Sumerlaeota bacterium]|nr:YicC family protein [Candidatus Sumerlaeota bacterium]
MTGFGSGRAESALGAMTVELRTVNNRFLDVSARIPQELSAAEPFARAELQKKIQRGKVVLNARFDAIPGVAEHYDVNRPLLAMLEQFCRDKGEVVSVAHLLTIPGVIVTQQDSAASETLQKLFASAFHAAMDALKKDRRREGDALRAALGNIHERMNAALEVVDKGRSGLVQKYQEKLHERIAELLGPKGATLDAGRLEQEVALFADRADIEEEMIRLRAHLARLSGILASDTDEGKGRALEFLNQEILREVNTIGSKSRDIDIVSQVLELKNLAESMKEQTANIE